LKYYFSPDIVQNMIDDSNTISVIKWYWFIAFCADKSIKWNGIARSHRDIEAFEM
jgi:hypothetical protein